MNQVNLPHLFTLTPCLALANDPMKKALVVSVRPLVVYVTYCIACRGSPRAISHLQTVAFYNSAGSVGGGVSCFNLFITHLKLVKIFVERNQIKFCKAF